MTRDDCKNFSRDTVQEGKIKALVLAKTGWLVLAEVLPPKNEMGHLVRRSLFKLVATCLQYLLQNTADVTAANGLVDDNCPGIS